MADTWTSVLRELRTRFPFLERIEVSGAPDSQLSVHLPGVLQVATAVAAGLRKAESPGNRAVLVFPRAHQTDIWLAVGAAVATVQQEWRDRVNDPLTFHPLQKLYIDNRPSVIVEFEREVVENGERYFYVRTDGGKVRIPIWKRFRFRPTQSTARPVQATTFLRWFSKDPPSTVLEHLTNSSTFGNDRLVGNGVILVTRLAATHRLAESTRVSVRNGQTWEAPLEDLFLWGALTSDGHLNPWGSGRAASDPLVVVTHLPGLISGYLDQEGRRNQKPLIILDGPHSLLNATVIVQELLDRGLPILAVLEDGEWDQEVRELLELSEFAIWRWSGDDLRSHALTPVAVAGPGETPFSRLEGACRCMARERQEMERCADDGQLSSAAQTLMCLRRTLGSDAERMDPLLRRWYGILLSLSRLLRPLSSAGGGGEATHEERAIAELTQELSHQHLGADARPLAQQVVNDLQGAVGQFRTGTPKIGGVEQVVDRMAGDGLRRGVVVLSDGREVEATAGYWQPRAASRWPEVELRFVTLADVQDIEGADFLIIAGWMGHERMFRLLHSHVAPVTVILAYPFEVSWHASAAKTWERRRQPETGRPSRARLLGLEPEKWPIDPPHQTAGSPPEVSTDATAGGMEFEIQLDRSRRQGHQAALSGPGDVDAVEAWHVQFTDGSYGYFTLDRRLLVVSDLTGRSSSTTLPQRTVDQLQVGDLVAFVEGADSDVLRRQADVGLRKAGLGHLRDIAGLWRKALRRFWQSRGGRLRPVVEALARAGCRRTPLTVRNWVTTDHTIGPEGNEADLRAIFAATGDDELRRRLQEVVQAIDTVRSAHLQASGYLHRELTAALPRLLAGSRREAKTVELEGLGRLTIVEIESLDREAVFVPEREANRRRTEG
jgi:hypothetical protein